MTEEVEQPAPSPFQALCERLDKACVRLLELQFPVTVPSAGTDAQAPEIDVEGSIKVFEAALNYLKWREKQETSKVAASPPKSGLAAYRERLSGESSGRGSAKARRVRSLGNSGNGTTARMGVSELPDSGDGTEPEPAAAPELN